MKICPKCKHKNKSRREKCTRCGAGLTGKEILKTCKACNHENSYAATKCAKCSESLVEKVDPTKKRKKKKHKNPGIPSEVRNIIFAIVFLGLVGGLIAFVVKLTDKVTDEETKQQQAVTDSLKRIEIAEIPTVDSTNVFITSNVDAEIFVDGESTGFFTNRKGLQLLPGKYVVSVKRDRYTIFPTSQELYLEKGKEVKMDFRLDRMKETVWTNILKVTSNSKRAKIFLNQNDTGYHTDHSFRNLEPGTYKVSLEKEGFETTEPKEIEISGNNKEYLINFDLTRLIRNEIIVKTEPVAGKIFVNGNHKGTGTYEDTYENVNSIELTFGYVPGYITPDPKTVFFFYNNKKEEVLVKYKKQIDLKVEIGNSGDIVSTGNIKLESGFFDTVKEKFVPEPNGNSVKTKKSDKHSFKYLELGYRTEGYGYATLKVTFNLPEDYDFRRKPTLKLWGYATNSNFPFTFVNNSKMAIVVNENYLKWKYSPYYNIDESKILDYEDHDLTRFLKTGENEILIRATEETTCYYAFQKLEIADGEESLD
ncbi:MAG: PEGA domain-containing protein [Calditrichaeota bacterium]|nr:MAG: PEGA domain-containing protein [Calditrichota bacterium]